MVRIDFNCLRFLVIDNNAPMRRILRTLLHDFAAREVYEAEDGASGLEAFFSHWIDSECARLDEERRHIAQSCFTSANKEALFHTAYDLKGEAATYGYPNVAAANDSLCRLIEHMPDITHVPLNLVD